MPSSLPPKSRDAHGMRSDFPLNQGYTFTFSVNTPLTFTTPITPDSDSTSSPASSARGSPAPNDPAPPSVLGQRRRRDDETQVKRPPNSFILFRSDFIAKAAKNIGEHDYRHISRMAGHVWKSLPPEKKKPFQDMAAERKRIHLEQYPDYIYRPLRREKCKRESNRKTEADLNRSYVIAERYSAGLTGAALEEFIKNELPPIPAVPKKKRRTTKKKKAEAAAVATSEVQAPAAPSPVATPSTSTSPSSYTSSLSSTEPEPVFMNPLLPEAEQEYIEQDYIAPQYAPFNADGTYGSSLVPDASYYADSGQLFSVDALNAFPEFVPIDAMYGSYGYEFYQTQYDESSSFSPSYDTPWDVSSWPIQY
ncbi:hypothetical protein CPB85DRAFT_171190 [Mucidula mucida]|nr:hypothetical protein CPB85DRAFT_171190 [Mucidula mucida]